MSLSNYDYAINVHKLHLQLFPETRGRIAPDYENRWARVELPIDKRAHKGLAPVRAIVICTKAKTRTHSRCNAGMRLWVHCPACGKLISAGRLHQHWGGKH